MSRDVPTAHASVLEVAPTSCRIAPGGVTPGSTSTHAVPFHRSIRAVAWVPSPSAGSDVPTAHGFRVPGTPEAAISRLVESGGLGLATRFHAVDAANAPPVKTTSAITIALPSTVRRTLRLMPISLIKLQGCRSEIRRAQPVSSVTNAARAATSRRSRHRRPSG